MKLLSNSDKNILALSFCFIFSLLFISITPVMGGGSHNNHEQWVNITNAMFTSNSDFLFSYGPLYWLLGGTTEQHSVLTYWMSVLFITTFQSFFWMFVFLIVYKSKGYIFFIVAFILFLRTFDFKQAYYLWSFLFVSLIPYYKGRNNFLIYIAIGMAIAFLFYIRFFYGLFSSIVIFSYLLSISIGDKNNIKLALITSAAIILSYVILGLLIFHNTESIISYIIINKNLSFGNSVDMSLDIISNTRAYIYIIVIYLLNVALLFVNQKNLILPFSLLFLLSFKLGYSRADHYISYFGLSMVVTVLIVTLRYHCLKSRLALISSLFLLYLILYKPAYDGGMKLEFPTQKSQQTANQDYTSRMRNIYIQYRLPKKVTDQVGSSTIDIYPLNNEYAFANGFNYNFRPLFQEYMTLTPELDNINKRFIESNTAPEYYLWTAPVWCSSKTECNPFFYIDKKYTLNEDPLTSLSILSNYHIVYSSFGVNDSQIILLKRNRDKIQTDVQSLRKQSMKFDQWYSVPDITNGIVKIFPNFKLSFYGKVKNTLYRGSILNAKYLLSSGEIIDVRLNVLNSINGVWISPFLDNLAGMSGKKVEKVMFYTDDPYYFQQDFTAEWKHFAIDSIHTAPPRKPTISDLKNVTPLDSHSCTGNIDQIRLSDQSTLSISGWLAYSTTMGKTMDSVYIEIQNKNRREIFPATRHMRQDVADAFKQKSLSNSGFIAAVPLDHAFIYDDDDKAISILGLSGNTLYKCTSLSNKILPKINHE